MSRTLFVTNFYPPDAPGGAGQVVQRQAQEADDAIVVTSAPWSGWGCWKPRKTTEEAVVVYRMWVPNIFHYSRLEKRNILFKLVWHIIDWGNLWSLLQLRRIIKKEQPDVVHTHNLMGMGYLIPQMVQNMGIVHVMTLHDIQLVQPSGVLPAAHRQDGFLLRFHAGLMKWLYKKPSVVYTPSLFLRRFYKKRGFFPASAWKVQPNFTWAPAPARPQNGKFCFVGTLNSPKGVHVLAGAWKCLAGHSFSLDIAGDGPLATMVKDWAEQDAQVQYHGRLGREDLEALYAQVDTLIFPSICIENHPNVIAEALSAGLHVIASDTGGVAEMVKGLPQVQLVLPGDIDALAAAMQC